MLEFFLVFFTFNIICLFPVFVQTLRNVIVFFLIVALTGCLASQLLNMEFYPVFLVLVYLGAIVVSTLFIILTFDIREEYRLRGTIEEWPVLLVMQNALVALLIITCSPVVNDVVNGHHEAAYSLASGVGDSDFILACSRSYTDLNSIASTMYFSFSEYFLSVGVVLTMALFVAISISRL